MMEVILMCLLLSCLVMIGHDQAVNYSRDLLRLQLTELAVIIGCRFVRQSSCVSSLRGAGFSHFSTPSCVPLTCEQVARPVCGAHASG